MNECFVITTYCNTYEKVEELKKCIKNLKQFNIDVLVHAHYPLSLDIQQSVKYYIYDSTNPVITDGSKVIVRWKWYVTANKLLTIPNPDYSYAVINQWVSSIAFLKQKNYDKIHIINYDTYFNDFIFKKHQEFLIDHDAIFEYTNLNPKDANANVTSNEKLIFIVYFSINKSFFDYFTDELTLEKYLQSKDTMLETFIMEVIGKLESNHNLKIKKFDDSQFKLYLGDAAKKTNIRKEDHDVYTTISEANGFDLVKKTKNGKDLYFVFGGENSEYGKFEILIFEITEPIKEIRIDIDGVITKENNITDKYYSLITNYSMLEIRDIINRDKLSITIDGEKVNNSVIEPMTRQGIKPKFS